jgi:integrase
VALPESLYAELQEWRKSCGNPPDDAFVFPSRHGTPLDSRNYLTRKLVPLAEKLGIHGLNYQVLRRTHATHSLKHGTAKDAQGQLRHASASTTLNIYAQVVPETQLAAAESFDREIRKAITASEGRTQ